MNKDTGMLEKRIGYRFRKKALLLTALTHSSYVRERCGGRSNERYEFIGDAFFDAIIGEKLFMMFPDREEGFLSRIRATLVCERSLARKAGEIDLGEFLYLGRGESRNGGRERESILADAMEAVIGAVYLDGGFEASRDMVLRLFRREIEDTRRGKFIVNDYKTALQEKLQSEGSADIRYVLADEEGPDHDKVFTVELEIAGVPRSSGRGKSKKQAEQQAARKLLEKGL